MKKLLSLLLVCSLVFGMSLSGFGAASITGFASGKTLADGVVKAELPTGATIDARNQSLHLGTQYAMDEVEFFVNLTAPMFGLPDTYVGPASSEEYAALNTDNFVTSSAIFNKIQAGKLADWKDVDDMLQRAANANPNELAKGISYEEARKQWARPNTTNKDDYTEWLKRYQKAGTEKDPLVTWVSSAKLNNCLYFTDVNGNPFSRAAEGKLVSRNLTSEEIQQNRITVGTSMTANSDAIRDISLQRNNGRIRVRLTNEWVSTAKKDFEIVLQLSFNGKRADNQKLTITGTIANPELNVYKDHDHVDLSKGDIANAIEFNNKVAVDVGNGATIHTRFFKNKKYYGISKREPDQSDQTVFKKYKDVDNVLTFQVVGLNSSSDTVSLSTDYSGYYVYDKDMNYLGRATERLPFSAKYYLANKKLTIKE